METNVVKKPEQSGVMLADLTEINLRTAFPNRPGQKTFLVGNDLMNGGKVWDTPKDAIIFAEPIDQELWLNGFEGNKTGYVILKDGNYIFMDIVDFDSETYSIRLAYRAFHERTADIVERLDDIEAIYKVTERMF